MMFIIWHIRDICGTRETNHSWRFPITLRCLWLRIRPFLFPRKRESGSWLGWGTMHTIINFPFFLVNINFHDLFDSNQLIWVKFSSFLSLSLFFLLAINLGMIISLLLVIFISPSHHITNKRLIKERKREKEGKKKLKTN